MPSIESTKASEGLVETSRRDEQSMEAHTDDDVTPRASIDRSHRENSTINTHEPSSHARASIPQDIDAIHTSTTSPPTAREPSIMTDAASTISPESNYAHSTIISTASLLSHDHDNGQRQSTQQTTKGRKAFTIFCHGLDIMFPIDINEDVTSMSESSIGKLGKAMQERGRRMTGAGREKEVAAKTA